MTEDAVPQAWLDVVEKLVAAGIAPAPPGWDRQYCRCYIDTITRKEHHCPYCMNMGIYEHRIQP